MDGVGVMSSEDEDVSLSPPPLKRLKKNHRGGGVINDIVGREFRIHRMLDTSHPDGKHCVRYKERTKGNPKLIDSCAHRCQREKGFAQSLTDAERENLAAHPELAQAVRSTDGIERRPNSSESRVPKCLVLSVLHLSVFRNPSSPVSLTTLKSLRRAATPFRSLHLAQSCC